MADTGTPIATPDHAKVEARLQRMVRRYTEVSGYHLNPDAVVVEGVVQGLVRSTLRYGQAYCPCRDVSEDPEQDRKIICPCIYHQDEIREDGHCRCVLFVGDNYDAEETYRPKLGSVTSAAVQSIYHRAVTVYSTAWCFHSRRVRSFLEQRNVPFENVDIEQDEAAGRQVEAWNRGYRSVPTVETQLIVVEPSVREVRSLLQIPRLSIGQLTAYVTRWCSQSRQIVNWLKEAGIEATYVDIEDNPLAGYKVQQWTGGYLSVPTLEMTLRVTEPDVEQLERMVGIRVS